MFFTSLAPVLSLWCKERRHRTSPQRWWRIWRNTRFYPLPIFRPQPWFPLRKYTRPVPTRLTRKWREMLRDSNITRGAHSHNAFLVSLACVSSEIHNLQRIFRPVGVVSYMGYIGMCRAKGYGFLAVLVWNRVSISTILVWNRVSFVHSRLELGMFF